MSTQGLRAQWAETATLRPALVVTLLSLALGACSVQRPAPRPGPAGEDEVAFPPFDVWSVPDPIPRPEPLSRYGNPPSYEVFGQRYYVLASSRGYRDRGIASWYGSEFHGRRTSSGEPYDMYAMTAAHKSLPLPTYARVTNLENGRRVIVRINDRGPFRDNRLLDLSYTAAAKLGILARGTGVVEVEAVIPGEEPPAQIARGPGPADPRPAALYRSRSLRPDPRSEPVVNPPNGPAIYLQVGAFADRNNAERLRETLEGTQIAAVQVQETSQDRRPIYRVRLGPIADVEEVDRLAQILATLGIRESRVVVD